MVEIDARSPGPAIGAFFDPDGTLVVGFTGAVHVGDRIRRRGRPVLASCWLCSEPRYGTNSVAWSLSA
jgi:hypothetical protein